MNPTFITGYSVQGFGVPETRPNLLPVQMDVEADIVDASMLYADALALRKMSVNVSMSRKFAPSVKPPNMQAKHALSVKDMSVSAVLDVDDFKYLVAMSIDARVLVDMIKPDARPLRVLYGCMNYILESRPSLQVLDNNHTAFDVIGGMGTCHYGDKKC